MTEITWLIVNGASGSNSDEAVHAVKDGFARGGKPVSRVIDVREGLPGPADLDAAGVTLAGVFAGDGTVNAVATALEGWGGALLILPGGTANLLARALHGETPAPDIAAGLAGLRRVRRSCIRSSQGTALVEVLAGPGATWSDVREEMREGAVGDIAGKAVDAIRQSTAGPMVALVDPELGKPDGYAGVRLDVSEDQMLVEGYGADTVGDYLLQGLALLRRNFREGPHDELGTHDSVTCRSLAGEPLPLMIDGERREGASTERFSLAPFALDLLASAG
jgi:hypothetical protein